MAFEDFWWGKESPKLTSLRFSGSQQLTRTSGVTGNQLTWTWSMWVKYTDLSQSLQTHFSAGNNNSVFTTNGSLTWQLSYYDYVSGAGQYDSQTAGSYRDPGAWYHIVCVRDTTQAIAADRIVIYINGIRVNQAPTSFGYPPLNNPGALGGALTYYIGHQVANNGSDPGRYFYGHMSDIFYSDGLNLPPTTFGQFDGNGVWIPYAFSTAKQNVVNAGGFGANGFALNFQSDYFNTGTLVWADQSGNGNDFTANWNCVAGTYWFSDLVGDAPTVNSFTLNPINPSNWAQNISTSNSVQSTTTANGGYSAQSTIAVDPTQDFYFEYSTLTNAFTPPSGGCPQSVIFYDYETVAQYTNQGSGWNFANIEWAKLLPSLGMIYHYFYFNNGQIQFYQNNPSSAGASVPIVSGSTQDWAYGNGLSNYTGIGRGGIYYNAATKEMTLYGANNDGTGTQSTIYDVSGWSTDFVKPWLISFSGQFQSGFFGGGSTQINPGPGSWVIEGRPSGVNPPSALQQGPKTVPNGTAGFQALLDTGANILSTAQAAVPSGLWWIKDRVNANEHQLVNSVSGTGSTASSPSRAVGAYSAPAGNSVAWCWAVPGAASANTNGSITSQVAANVATGFSIVTYTTTGGTGTVGHGLGSPPEFIIAKDLNQPTYGFQCYSKAIGAANYMTLNTASPAFSDPAMWVTDPTSTVFTVGASFNNVPAGDTVVAYCWAPVSGYSSFGSYQGNSSDDGPFIYTGFKPAFLLIKCTTTGGREWRIVDNSRNTYNPENLTLKPSSTLAEQTFLVCDFVSNGFKIRNGSSFDFGDINQSGQTYIYAAFAENPFGGSNVAPVTAR